MKDPFNLCGKAAVIAFSIIFVLALIGDIIECTIFFYICFGIFVALCVYFIINWKCPYCKKGLPLAVAEFCPYCGKRIHYKDDTQDKE